MDIRTKYLSISWGKNCKLIWLSDKGYNFKTLKLAIFNFVPQRIENWYVDRQLKKWFGNEINITNKWPEVSKQGIWVVPIVTNWFPKNIRMGLKSKEESIKEEYIERT